MRPGAEAQFDALVAETAAGIRQSEPGTLVYACHHVDGEPRQRIFYELYRENLNARGHRAAFDAHEQSLHTRRFLADREALLESKAVDFLDLADGKTPATIRAAS